MTIRTEEVGCSSRQEHNYYLINNIMRTIFGHRLIVCRLKKARPSKNYKQNSTSMMFCFMLRKQVIFFHHLSTSKNLSFYGGALGIERGGG